MCSITFDPKTLLDTTGDNPETLSEIVAYFLTDTPKQLDSLSRAIAANDANAAVRIAHSLKGVAATVGCQALSAAALSTEQCCRGQGFEGVDDSISHLKQCFSEARRELLASGLVESSSLGE